MVFWRLRYKLSLRDLPEMFLIRGIEFSYEAVRDWEAKLTPSLIGQVCEGGVKAGLARLVHRRDVYQGERPVGAISTGRLTVPVPSLM